MDVDGAFAADVPTPPGTPSPPRNIPIQTIQLNRSIKQRGIIFQNKKGSYYNNDPRDQIERNQDQITQMNHNESSYYVRSRDKSNYNQSRDHISRQSRDSTFDTKTERHDDSYDDSPFYPITTANQSG